MLESEGYNLRNIIFISFRLWLKEGVGHFKYYILKLY